MSLSKEQQNHVLKELDIPYNNVILHCDGHDVTLRLVRMKMKLVVDIYIDQMFKGIWLTEPDKHPEAKFLPTKKVKIYSQKSKAEIIKVLGKREAKKSFPDLDKVIESKSCYFTSPKAALNHLIKVSDSIELLAEMAA